jgi:hypothetical protein
VAVQRCLGWPRGVGRWRRLIPGAGRVCSMRISPSRSETVILWPSVTPLSEQPLGHPVGVDGPVEQDDRVLGGLGPRDVGDHGVAGMVVDELKDHGLASAGQDVLGRGELPARVRRRLGELSPCRAWSLLRLATGVWIWAPELQPFRRPRPVCAARRTTYARCRAQHRTSKRHLPGASGGHWEIARRTRESMGSLADTTAGSPTKCHHQGQRKRHRCPDTKLSAMSCDITPRLPIVSPASDMPDVDNSLNAQGLSTGSRTPVRVESGV